MMNGMQGQMGFGFQGQGNFGGMGFNGMANMMGNAAWNNMNPDGSPNVATLHEGMPVVKGTKYIVTKWFREASWLKT